MNMTHEQMISGITLGVVERTDVEFISRFFFQRHAERKQGYSDFVDEGIAKVYILVKSDGGTYLEIESRNGKTMKFFIPYGIINRELRFNIKRYLKLKRKKEYTVDVLTHPHFMEMIKNFKEAVELWKL